MTKNLTIFVIYTAFAFTQASTSVHGNDRPWLYERKIIGENNLRAIEGALGTANYDYARTLARVEHVGTDVSFCSASRVGPNLFLTNFHCDNDCSVMQFTMGFEKDIPEAERMTFACKELVHSFEELDYALFIAEPVDDTMEHDYPILTLSEAPIEVGQKVMLASHPWGRFKELDDSDECVISDTVPFMTASGRNTIKHMCDTEGGSSGSPVIDRETGHAIGLHWGGRTEFNMAIPMDLILKHMQENLPESTFSQLSVAAP